MLGAFRSPVTGALFQNVNMILTVGKNIVPL
jgi:hypothetical protein